MSELSTPINIAAGATAVTVSVSQSTGAAESLYRATLDQLFSLSFNFVVSDLLGLVSVTVIVTNLILTLRRERASSAERNKG